MICNMDESHTYSLNGGIPYRMCDSIQIKFRNSQNSSMLPEVSMQITLEVLLKGNLRKASEMLLFLGLSAANTGILSLQQFVKLYTSVHLPICILDF